MQSRIHKPKIKIKILIYLLFHSCRIRTRNKLFRIREKVPDPDSQYCLKINSKQFNKKEQKPIEILIYKLFSEKAARLEMLWAELGGGSRDRSSPAPPTPHPSGEFF